VELLRLDDDLLERREKGLNGLSGVLTAASCPGTEASIRRFELEVRMRFAEHGRPVLATHGLVLGEQRVDVRLRHTH
jgi:hypothetical protein